MATLIVVPTLRERNNLEKLIPELFRLFPHGHVVIVDDHSRDGTAELLVALARNQQNLFFLERLETPGYGRSILAGLRWASERGYQQVLAMDADFSHDPKEVPRLIEKLSQADVVIGSRYVSGGGIENWSWHRRLLSRFSNWYVRMILGLPFRDSTTGFVAYGSRALERLMAQPPQSEGYSFLVECKFKLFKAGCVFIEHPISYTERREGQSKMSLKNIWEAVWMPWRLRFFSERRTL